jgi:hypothetical protein
MWSFFSLGTVCLFTQSVEQIFTSHHGWTPIQAEYLHTAVFIGELCGFHAAPGKCSFAAPNHLAAKSMYPAVGFQWACPLSSLSVFLRLLISLMSIAMAFWGKRI